MVGIDMVMMPPKEFLNCWHQFILLISCSEHSSLYQTHVMRNAGSMDIVVYRKCPDQTTWMRTWTFAVRIWYKGLFPRLGIMCQHTSKASLEAQLDARPTGCRFDPSGSATFFRGDWSWNIFYSHSLPFVDSRRAVVSFWRKNVYSTG